MMKRPTEPGQILYELYLQPDSITIAKFARIAGLSRKHLSDVINGYRPLRKKTAERVAAVLGTTTQYWINLQEAVDTFDKLNNSEKKKRGPFYKGGPHKKKFCIRGHNLEDAKVNSKGRRICYQCDSIRAKEKREKLRKDVRENIIQQLFET